MSMSGWIVIIAAAIPIGAFMFLAGYLAALIWVYKTWGD